jgi:hypothetical protein
MLIRKNGCILLSLSRFGGLFKQIPPRSNSVCVPRPPVIIAVLLPSRRALPFYMTLLPTCRGKEEINLLFGRTLTDFLTNVDLLKNVVDHSTHAV